VTERRWRDVRMPPDALRGELYEKLRAAQAASPGDPRAWIAPADWWPEVVRVLGLPVVRRVEVTELTVSMDDPDEIQNQPGGPRVDPDIVTCRRCGICEQRSIPRGISWQWWSEGQPVHLGCLVDKARRDPTWAAEQAAGAAVLDEALEGLEYPNPELPPEPWIRHSLYRITDQTLITEYIVPPSRSIVWTPDRDFDPRYPEGYEWRVTEIAGQTTERDSAGDVRHTATWDE
jgi:hypothetical protein